MTEKQALEVIKQVIDIAIQRGNFQNAESVALVLQAFQVISSEKGIPV